MFVVDEFARCDMDQGYIGNCWFIAACVGIMQNKKLFSKVVPKDQSFSDNYTGLTLNSEQFCFQKIKKLFKRHV